MSRFAIGILVLLGASQAFSAAEPAAAPPSPQQIQRLIEALGDADYFSRQKAESDLGKIGFAAIEALTAATEHDDMEIASRASRLLSTIRSNWSVPGEPADVAQWLANYESQDDANREARVVPLANLPENEGVPAVCHEIGVGMTTGEWLCYPNDDSYYCPWFAERLLAHAEANNLEFVYSDIVIGRPDIAHYPLSCQPWACAVDKTCYMFKREWFQPFPDQFTGQYGVADGLLVNALVARGIRHGKLPQLLVFHN